VLVVGHVGDAETFREGDGGVVIACVLAGGSGTRLGADANKVLLPIRGRRSILDESIHTFELCEAVDHIVVVARHQDQHIISRRIKEERITKVRTVVPGGSTRHGSEQAGFEAVRALLAPGAGVTDVVLVHDGARPFVTIDLVVRLVEAAQREGGAVPGLNIQGVLWTLRDGRPVGTVPSEYARRLRRMQTPQAFRAGPLLEAYAAAAAAGFDGVDTAATVERFASLETVVVESDPRNLKVTTRADLAVARRLAGQFTDGAWL
jgi:2-C-methyl-D-erythritol 4-phosphate cytidylyltransferase